MNKKFQFRNKVEIMKKQEVAWIIDEKGRQYVINGDWVFRLIKLQGKYGRPKKDKYNLE